jgi:hypothetical protein
MMIAQRRPMRSASQPQNSEERKKHVLAIAIGSATRAGLRGNRLRSGVGFRSPARSASSVNPRA